VQLVYIEFGTDNGGMIKNVSEGGMRFFLMNPVITGHKLQFGMTIDPARRIEGDASIIWSDPSGKSGGLSFAGLSSKAQQTLRSWLAEMDGALSAEPSPAAHEARPAAVVAAAELEATAPPTVEKVSLPPAGTSAPALAAVPPATPNIVTAPPVAAETSPATIAAPRATRPALPGAMPPPPAERSTSVAERLLPRAPVLTYDTPRLATREEWRRALREESAPAEKPKPETSPEKMIAALTETLPAIEPPTAPGAPPLTPADALPGEPSLRPHDPAPSFLRPSPAVETQISAKSRRELFVPREPDEQAHANPRVTGVSRTRLAMILALAAICGAAAAFAGIAYRRDVGESLIAIGKRISGDSRSGATTNEPQSPPAAQDIGAAAQAGPPQETPHARPPERNPVDAGQQSEQATRDARETAGKPKPPQQDISSLWVAVQNGDAAAELVLANRYIAGEGVAKNCEQARVLLEAAAKRGNPAATRRLADLPTSGCSQ
jgi:hypothetical protein